MLPNSELLLCPASTLVVIDNEEIWKDTIPEEQTQIKVVHQKISAVHARRLGALPLSSVVMVNKQF